jgi:hypothetical protein
MAIEGRLISTRYDIPPILIHCLEFGVTKTVDLIPNGSNIAVTRENRLTYIYLVSHYRLSKQIKQQSEAFFEGLSEMIDQKWLRYVFVDPYFFGFVGADGSIAIGCSTSRKCKS